MKQMAFKVFRLLSEGYQYGLQCMHLFLINGLFVCWEVFILENEFDIKYRCLISTFEVWNLKFLRIFELHWLVGIWISFRIECLRFLYFFSVRQMWDGDRSLNLRGGDSCFNAWIYRFFFFFLYLGIRKLGFWFKFYLKSSSTWSCWNVILWRDFCGNCRLC